MAHPNENQIHRFDLIALHRQSDDASNWSRHDSEDLHQALLELHSLNQSANIPCEDDDCPVCEARRDREVQAQHPKLNMDAHMDAMDHLFRQEQAAHQENKMNRRSLYSAA